MEKEILTEELTPDPEETPEDLGGELAALKDNYTRLAADFANYRKRTLRQTEEVVARATENMVCKLLPVLDNFCIALESLSDQSVLKGMSMIYEQLVGVLAQEGVRVIETEGCSFDPQIHEAVTQVHLEETPDNLIVEEVRKGYMLGGKVIRPAAVKVNIKKEE